MASGSRFVLIGHARSGSTWLAQALAEHDNILMYGEVLNPDPGMRAAAIGHGLRYETYLDATPAPYAPLRPAAEFIEDLFRVAGRTEHSAVGFKIHYEHAWGGSVWNSAWKLIFGDPQIRKIHLFRRDLLRTYVSLQIAIETDQWVATEEHPAGPRGHLRLHIAIPEFRAFVRHCRRMQRLIRAYAKVQPVLELEYEKTVAVRAAETCLSVFEWLGQPRQLVENYIVKQDDFDVEHVVLNYAEVSECWRAMADAPDL